jgi:hypothetical protein
MRASYGLAAVVACGLLLASWQVWTAAEQPARVAGAAASAQVASAERFKFEVIQSFDAKYEGDTPGHVGKSGGLGERRPRVALGDPVFRGEEQVGTVTGLTWSRPFGSLEVEFDPVEKVRISVGDEVWLNLDSTNPAR